MNIWNLKDKLSSEIDRINKKKKKILSQHNQWK